MSKKSTTFKPILLRVPEPLLKRIDKEAEKEGRSRTSEICQRLQRSLKKTEATA